MVKTFTLQDLAPELDDAKVAAWHIQQGDAVREDDDLLEVITDKAAITIPCPVDGSVIRCDCPIEKTLKTADPVVTIEV